MAKKKSKWIKFRHKVVTSIAYLILYPYTVYKYGIKIERFKDREKRPYLILLNHQTPFDQFFVGMSFIRPIYYLATEDIFSLGWISSLLRWAVAPIPIRKQTTDVSAVMNCIRVAKEGGSICIAPEGNRTYSGKTEYMNPSIAPLAKKLKLPIVLYRIEGGYGSEPRWSDCVRKGKMKAYVSEVIRPEDAAEMSNEELFQRIEKGLFVDESNSDGIFKSNHKAEYLERAIYVCPFCGLSEFESNGNFTQCKKCHRKIEYGEDKLLTGVGFDFPFKFMAQWYDYQKDFINRLDVTEYTDTAIYTDTADISEVLVFKNKLPFAKDSEISLFGDRIIFNSGKDNELILPFESLSAVTVLGKNKLNVYFDKKVYQLKGDKRFNALKYVNIYFRYKNIKKGDMYGEFLGI